MNPTTLYDPTDEGAPTRRERRAPPRALDGAVVALQDIGKIRSDEFLDHIERLLEERGVRTIRSAKPTNAKRAPTETLQRIATEADVVVQALAD
ncbi:MAG: hypothetical protein MJB57_04540 [Gemmatimonadetes bacterium]|nr:hypothetical protein [Gemmatimonadota bacterium]